MRTTALPREGKTYSLFGNELLSDEYFSYVHLLADELSSSSGPQELLRTVLSASRSKRRLKVFLKENADHSIESAILRTLHERLSQYTMRVDSHLRNLSLKKRWDRTLSTIEGQYHLYMLEIELVNRLNMAEFRRASRRLAFLPHCLRDLTADCRSSRRGDDYVCKGCSKICNVNAVSKLLRRHGTTPYIWMTANLPSLLKSLQEKEENVGVLGIACIPELVHGMRLCARLDVPVVGVPLDANRCARWWGEFYPNSVNIRELECLLGEETRVRPRHADEGVPRAGV